MLLCVSCILYYIHTHWQISRVLDTEQYHALRYVDIYVYLYVVLCSYMYVSLDVYIGYGLEER